MILKGKVWKFGDDVDTDLIIPARYLTTTDQAELARHCMEPLRPDWAALVAPGDIVAAGKNFGCGSSREHAPKALRGCGVTAVVAVSFARIFYRNAFNIGLPVIELPEAARAVEEGDELEIDLEGGTVRNLGRGSSYRFPPVPEFMMSLIRAGGLMPWLKEELAAAGGS